MVVMFSPSIRTSPLVGSIRRLRRRTNVDLPEPDNPMMTNISPSSMARLAFCTPTVNPVLSKIWSLFIPDPNNSKARLGCSPNILYRFFTSSLIAMQYLFSYLNMKGIN